jgi:hypothetical protein
MEIEFIYIQNCNRRQAAGAYAYMQYSGSSSYIPSGEQVGRPQATQYGGAPLSYWGISMKHMEIKKCLGTLTMVA